MFAHQVIKYLDIIHTNNCGCMANIAASKCVTSVFSRTHHVFLGQFDQPRGCTNAPKAGIHNKNNAATGILGPMLCQTWKKKVIYIYILC